MGHPRGPGDPPIAPVGHRLATAAACVLLAAAVACGEGDASGNPETSGIEGVVRSGPSCPVEQEGVECPDRPVEVDLRIRDGDGNVVSSLRSGRDGRFRVELAPGQYVVEALPEGEAVSAKPVDVSVVDGTFSDAIVAVDTGVRGPPTAGEGPP